MAKAKKKELVSEYEELLGDRADKPGRPKGTQANDVAFSFKGRDHSLAAAAKRRAMAVLLAEGRERAREIFENEYEVLVQRQGYEDVPVVKRTVAVEVERRALVGGRRG